ncbi:hypothetical protein AB0B15_14195 [Streptomyces sp. NPDC045456]|uniref:hypothetical protein n=1 Tax=Streptomyces sp. NPDC045456 TaxID=3155254 RepID=UPI0033CEA9C2
MSSSVPSSRSTAHAGVEPASTGVKPAAPPPPSRLMTAPLPELLAELGVVLATSGVDDPRFAGEAIRLDDGSVVLAMPPGWDPALSDLLARKLIGQELGVLAH